MDLRDIIFRNLDPPAQQWLWTQEPDNSVSPANLDSSISFAVRDEKVDGQRQEMLIVPQVVEDNYVLGSVFGTISRDIQIGQSSRVSTTESTCRRFCVDLRTGEMLQALWFPSDRVSFARHLVRRDGDWFNEIFSLESQSEQQGTMMSTVSVSKSFRDCAFCVARRTPCACDDSLRMRTFGSGRQKSFGNWMDWASYFVTAGNGTFRTHVSKKSGGQKGNIWWSCAAALGDDCTAMMQKRQVVSALCHRSYKLGIQSNAELAMMSKAARQLLPPVGSDESENSDGSPSLVSVWDEERHSGGTPVRQHLKRQFGQLMAGVGSSAASNTTTESLNSLPAAGRNRKRESADEGDGRHVPNEQTQVVRDASWWQDEETWDAVMSTLQNEPQPRRKRLKAAIV